MLTYVSIWLCDFVTVIIVAHCRLFRQLVPGGTVTEQGLRKESEDLKLKEFNYEEWLNDVKERRNEVDCLIEQLGDFIERARVKK